MHLDICVGNLIEPITGRRWSTAETLARVRGRASRYRHHGLEAGDLVLVHFGNNLEFFAELLAIWQVGGCVVPIDARLTPYEVHTLARASGARFSVWHGDPDAAVRDALDDLNLQHLDAAESGDEEALPTAGPGLLDGRALVLFTSGTTGDPKGVVHTHRSLRARWIGLRDRLGIRAFRRTLCLLPTHFGHGLICNALYPWLSGADLYVVPPFRAEIVTQLGTLLDEHEITFMSSVPSVWRLAEKIARPPRRETLERVFCGSAPLSAHLWKRIRAWTAANEVLNAYGITETGSWVAGTTVEGFEPEDGLIGEPWGAVIRVLREADTSRPLQEIDTCAPGEQGCLWINTPALMQGYLGRDDLTRVVVNQGWFMTGDIGVVDERGWLYLRGREREEINTGGMKVYPADVDAVAERFAGTADVCCFPIEDSLYGQDVGLALVMEDRLESRLVELREWLEHHLARHQRPVRWYLVDSIPRTSRGKINRELVARTCLAREAIDPKKLL